MNKQEHHQPPTKAKPVNSSLRDLSNHPPNQHPVSSNSTRQIYSENSTRSILSNAEEFLDEKQRLRLSLRRLKRRLLLERVANSKSFVGSVGAKKSNVEEGEDDGNVFDDDSSLSSFSGSSRSLSSLEGDSDLKSQPQTSQTHRKRHHNSTHNCAYNVHHHPRRVME
jgi:hypothetical protein